MKHFPLLLVLFLFISENTNCQVVTDTFVVNKIPLGVQVPQGWILEEVNDGLCSDTTYNFVMRYQINKPELGGHVAVQFLMNKRASASDQDNAKKEYEVRPNKLGKWDAHYVTYFPKKVKECKNCGKEYMDVHVVPVGEDVTMYIYFVAHGSDENVISLRQGFSSFVNLFFLNNGAGLDHFLLLNQMIYPNIQDTAITSAGMISFYYNEKFTVRKSDNGFSLTQLGFFYSGLNLIVTARVVTGEQANHDTTVASTLGMRPGSLQLYGSPLNFLSIKCRRYLGLDDGTTLELSFDASVQIEEEALVNYYKRVVQQYANTIADLNADNRTNNKLFSFATPMNPRRSRDIITLSGSGTRYGHINHDSLLLLMPGYLSARDSVNNKTEVFKVVLSEMDNEITRKQRELDSLRGLKSPLILAVMQNDIDANNERRADFKQIADDSVSYYDAKFLGKYFEALKAAEQAALQNSKCDGMIDSQNIPVPDKERNFEFINLNSEVGRLLNAK